MQNQLSRYGAIARALPYLGVQGQLFMVAPASASWYADFAATFPVDSYGNVRVFTTVQAAVTACVADRGDVVLVAPGDYDESVTVAKATTGITIVGLGTLVGTNIDPTTAAATALTVHGKNVRLVNIDVNGDSTATYAAKITGSGFRAIDCKFEGVDTSGSALILGPGTAAQVTANTAGKGGDAKFVNCEFAWSANGVNLTGTDYGAATQMYFENCRFHNLSASSFKETVGSGGAATTTYRNLEVKGCIFDNMEDGTVPTAFFVLNGNNANTGIVADSSFPLATNATGKNLVSTKLIWVANRTAAGTTTAQPS